MTFRSKYELKCLQRKGIIQMTDGSKGLDAMKQMLFLLLQNVALFSILAKVFLIDVIISKLVERVLPLLSSIIRFCQYVIAINIHKIANSGVSTQSAQSKTLIIQVIIFFSVVIF